MGLKVKKTQNDSENNTHSRDTTNTVVFFRLVTSGTQSTINKLRNTKMVNALNFIFVSRIFLSTSFPDYTIR